MGLTDCFLKTLRLGFDLWGLIVGLMAAFRSLQRSLPQAPPPPPPTRWMKRAAQRETCPVKDNQIEMVVDDLQQQHEKQLLLDAIDLNQESLKEKNSCVLYLESKRGIEAVAAKFPNFIQKGGGYCKYHQVNGHSIRECRAIKNAIQDLIDQEKIDPAEIDHRAKATSMPVTS
ncbi:hypothetical protein RHMOL_Rhmol08G0171300 [Rhododendron molle]|uniref:Uncharacterized protein n=1 Tax=Rhododendron molle TaxID=49168 RepID=A0ACC0MP57_RHOML|nr:hypothetical protein RHMOL_Rhmol08G0171300 [Rhododendron molle]